MTRPHLSATLFVTLAYIGTIVAANWAITTFGAVPVGFGLLAPAGVYFAGLAFGLRDLLHHLAGSRVVLVAILSGAALAWEISGPAVAGASALAFAVSEMLDMAVYTPLAKRRPYLAVLASNTVGLAVDSALFLFVAFGSLAYFWGQVVGKGWM